MEAAVIACLWAACDVNWCYNIFSQLGHDISAVILQHVAESAVRVLCTSSYAGQSNWKRVCQVLAYICMSTPGCLQQQSLRIIPA